MKSRSKDFIELGVFILLGLAAVVGFAACGVYFDHKHGYDVKKVQVINSATVSQGQPHEGEVLRFDGKAWVFKNPGPGTTTLRLEPPVDLSTPKPASKPAKPHKNAKERPLDGVGPLWNPDKTHKKRKTAKKSTHDCFVSVGEDGKVIPMDEHGQPCDGIFAGKLSAPLSGDITVQPDKPDFTPPPAFDDQDKKEI